jgi:hypothetical protein
MLSVSYDRAPALAPSGKSVTPRILPDWALLAIGYSLFIWSSLSLIDLWFVTPDIAVAALVSLLTGIMVRIQLAPRNWSLFLSFGIFLALGYLTKATLLPLTLVYLLCTLILIGDLKVAIPRLGVTLVTLLLIVGPYVAVLSISKGHFTLGDTGKLAYAFMVNKLPLIHWRGEPPGSGIAAHPSRQIHSDPPVYEFDGPVRGTYPMEYDWSYWNAGMAPHFDLLATLAAIKRAVRQYLRAFVDSQGAILVAAVTLYSMSSSAWLANLARGWFLIVPGAAGLALYSPVWVEYRYVGGFVALVWLGVFAGVQLQDTEQSRRAAIGISLVVLIVTLVHVAMPIYDRARAPRSDLEERLMLDALRDMGLGPGSKIAIIGSSFGAYWARLGRVRIIAEIPAHTTDPEVYYLPTTAAQRFWQADARVKEEVMKAFAQTGARATFAVDAPTALGWRRIDRTSYSVYLLP